MPNKIKEPYPNWFIDELKNNTDKERAREGNLPTTSIVEFICPKHGTYKQRISSHIKRSSGERTSGCPLCKNDSISNAQKAIRNTKREYPQWFIDELIVEEHKRKAIDGSLTTKDKVVFNCPIHGPYTQIVNNHIVNGKRKSGCPECSKIEMQNKISETLSKNEENSNRLRSYNEERRKARKFPDWLLKEVSEDDRQKMLTGNVRSDDYVTCTCPKHGPYKIQLHNRYWSSTLSPKHGCPKCVVTNQHSSFEDEVNDFIQSLRSLEVCKNTRDIIQNSDTGRWLEIDIYYPLLKLAIECNGSYYHSTVGGNPEYYKEPLYHQKKFLECEKKGIHLINLFDVDWYNNTDKIKSYLKTLVVKPNKYYARSCDIRTVSYEQAKDFEDSYHLQGYSSNSTIHIGLYYQDQLLSVMSFGKPRFGYRSYAYELHRYCVKEGVTVIGGAQKLFKRFIETHPGDILSYSDNDYFMGSIYSNLGFEFNGLTNPGYYWCKSHYNVYTREQCQLNKLKTQYPKLYEESEGKGNREDYIMSSLGYMKVYRSGNKRWVYNQD